MSCLIVKSLIPLLTAAAFPSTQPADLPPLRSFEESQQWLTNMRNQLGSPLLPPLNAPPGTALVAPAPPDNGMIIRPPAAMDRPHGHSFEFNGVKVYVEPVRVAERSAALPLGERAIEIVHPSRIVVEEVISKPSAASTK